MACFVVGLLAGIFGLFAGMGAVGLGGLGSVLDASGGGTVVGLGLIAFLMAALLLIGASLVMSRRKAPGVILLVLGTADGFLTVSYIWTFAGILGAIATVLGLMARGARTVAAPPG